MKYTVTSAGPYVVMTLGERAYLVHPMQQETARETEGKLREQLDDLAGVNPRSKLPGDRRVPNFPRRKGETRRKTGVGKREKRHRDCGGLVVLSHDRWQCHGCGAHSVPVDQVY